MSSHENITLVPNAIHNPNEPRHFMQIVPAGRRYVADINGIVLANSDDALIVKEVGRGIYDPVVYFPRDDVHMEKLTGINKSTHCPLKGDTEYFDITAGSEHAAEAAWSYVDMVAGFELQHLIAFDPTHITITR